MRKIYISSSGEKFFLQRRADGDLAVMYRNTVLYIYINKSGQYGIGTAKHYAVWNRFFESFELVLESACAQLLVLASQKERNDRAFQAARRELSNFVSKLELEVLD